MGLSPTEINLTSQAVHSGSNPEVSWWTRLTTEKKVDTLELMLFSRQMYTLLKAGVPIMRALAGLQESTNNPAGSPQVSGQFHGKPLLDVKSEGPLHATPEGREDCAAPAQA